MGGGARTTGGLTLAGLLEEQSDVRCLVLSHTATSLRALAPLRRVARRWRGWVDCWVRGALPKLCVLGGGHPPSEVEVAAEKAANSGATVSAITVVNCVHALDPASILGAAGPSGPPASGWSRLPDLHAPRCAAAACGLPDGRVFVAGGMDQELDPLRDAFIYDPTGSTPGGHLDLYCRKIAPYPAVISGARAVLLSCGQRVLVVGGDSVVIEERDENSGLMSSMMLPNVRQPVGGGEHSDDEAETGAPTTLRDANIYNLETGEWSPVSPMLSPRAHFAIGMLTNGKVVVAGGLCSVTEVVTYLSALTDAEQTLTSHGSTPLADAEIYDPSEDSWTALPPLKHGPRAGCSGAVLTHWPTERPISVCGSTAATTTSVVAEAGRVEAVFVVVGGDGEDGNLCMATEAMTFSSDLVARNLHRRYAPSEGQFGTAATSEAADTASSVEQGNCDNTWLNLRPLPAVMYTGASYGICSVGVHNCHNCIQVPIMDSIIGTCSVGSDLLVLWKESGLLNDNGAVVERMRLAVYGYCGSSNPGKWFHVPEPWLERDCQGLPVHSEQSIAALATSV